MKHLILVCLVLVLQILPHPAQAATCTPETLDGLWQRFNRHDEPLDAIWRFRPDTNITCQGKKCDRAAGRPVSYTLRGGKLTISFETGRLKDANCRVKKRWLILGGGADRGGLTFRRID